MPHLMDKATIGRAGTAVTEGAVLGGFAVCALAAVLYDLWNMVQ